MKKISILESLHLDNRCLCLILISRRHLKLHNRTIAHDMSEFMQFIIKHTCVTLYGGTSCNLLKHFVHKFRS